MAVAVQGNGSNNSGASQVSSITITSVDGGGSNRGICAGLSVRDGALRDATATWDAATANEDLNVDQSANTGNITQKVFSLEGQTSGTLTLTIDPVAGTKTKFCSVAVVTLNGVDQMNGFANTAQATGSSQVASVSVTSDTDELAIGFVTKQTSDETPSWNTMTQIDRDVTTAAASGDDVWILSGQETGTSPTHTVDTASGGWGANRDWYAGAYSVQPAAVGGSEGPLVGGRLVRGGHLLHGGVLLGK